MGSNGTWAIFEKVIIELYNQNLLTKGVLRSITKIFSSTDIDSGRYVYYPANDGKILEQICVEVEFPEFRPVLPDGWDDMTWIERSSVCNDSIHADWEISFPMKFYLCGVGNKGRCVKISS